MVLAMVMAGTAAAAMLAALMVVIADRVGVKAQITGSQSLRSVIRHTDHTGIEHNARLHQSTPGTAADTAADQNVRPQLGQKCRQSAVTAAVGGDHHGVDDLTVLNIVHLEQLGVAKMLEDLAVFFISNRNSQIKLPPMILLFFLTASAVTASVKTAPAAAVAAVLAHVDLSSGN